MAKLTKSVSFKNAVIEINDKGEILITEITKDNSFDYNLLQVLQDWNGIEGISLSLKIDEEMMSMDDSNNKGD